MTIKSQIDTVKDSRADEIDAVIGANMKSNRLDRFGRFRKAIVAGGGGLAVTAINMNDTTTAIVTAVISVATVVGVYLAWNDE